MIRRNAILLTGILLMVASSCNKWLDVQPKSEVAADALFESAEGFKEALNGVYTRLAQGDLYGDELTCGSLDVMAQNFTLSTTLDGKHYLPTQKFDFEDGDFKSRRDRIWGGLYNAIVNVNLILEHIDSKKDIFTGIDYDLIKGEALGLRAYVHFDLWRMFGSSYGGSQSFKGLPYVTTYSNKVTKAFDRSAYMAAVEKDLVDAKALLKVDPLLAGDYVVDYPGSDSSTENSNPTLFLQNRRFRLNYYAVTAELARLYLYQQQPAKALPQALEVIESQKFPWTKQQDFINSDPKTSDRILFKELIFSWYAPWEVDDLKSRFESGTAGLFLSQEAAQHIYETNGVGGEDLRYKEWFQVGINGQLEFRKYARNPEGAVDDPSSNLYEQILPAIRLSELYYIAAEASYDTDPVAALKYLNAVRANRGMGSTLTIRSKAELLNELLKDARKEFYGEGQLFYMYKRLYMDIQGQAGMVIPASSQIFILPLPNNEIEFGNR